jgi:hypothetical protein
VLSTAEAAALDRGQTLKRYVRAAAALNGLYDDTAIGDAVEVNRGAVSRWWDGAQMKPDTIRRLSEVTGLSFDELTRFVYLDGPPPALPIPERVSRAGSDAEHRDSLLEQGRDPEADGEPDDEPDRRPA